MQQIKNAIYSDRMSVHLQNGGFFDVNEQPLFVPKTNLEIRNFLRLVDEQEKELGRPLDHSELDVIISQVTEQKTFQL